MRFFKYCMLLSVVMAGKCFGQGVEIGKVVPDVYVERVYNSKERVQKLSAIAKGKPMVVVFWTSTCGTCRKFLSTLDTLEPKLRSKLQFVLVTADKEAKMSEFVSTHAVAKRLKIPMIAGDTLMRTMFHHLTVPHVVWLNSKRRVEGITGHDAVTIQNLVALSGGVPLQLREKKEKGTMAQFMAADPMMTYDYKETKESIIEYSYFSGYRDDMGVGASRYIDTLAHSRLAVRNYDVKNLYSYVHPEVYPLHATQVIFPESSAFTANENKSGIYCYDLVIKQGTRDSIYGRMQQDLVRFFGYKSYVEKREMDCYVLIRTVEEDKIKSKSDKRGSYTADGETVVRKWTLAGVIQFYLNQLPYKVIDETNYKGEIDIVLPERVTDVQLVNLYLSRYGIQLVKSKRVIDVIVIAKE